MHWQLTKQTQYFRQKLQQMSLRRFTSPCCCWLSVIQLGSRFLWLITCSTEDHQDLRQAVHCCWSPSILTTTYNRSAAPIMKPPNNPNPQKEEKNCKKLRTRHQNPENQNTTGSQKWSNTYLIDRRHDQISLRPPTNLPNSPRSRLNPKNPPCSASPVQSTQALKMKLWSMNTFDLKQEATKKSNSAKKRQL